MVRGSEERKRRGEVRVRGSGAVRAMDQNEALETTVVKAVKRARLLQSMLLLLLCLIAAVVVVVVVVERIALGASCTKCREATIALEAGAGNWAGQVNRDRRNEDALKYTKVGPLAPVVAWSVVLGQCQADMRIDSCCDKRRGRRGRRGGEEARKIERYALLWETRVVASLNRVPPV